jgi:hypothetical protein
LIDGFIFFVKCFGTRIVDVDGCEMIGGNVRFGFAIEEPAVLFYDGFIKDVFFSIDVSCVLKGGSQILMFKRAVTKYLLMFRRENEIGTLNMNTVFDGTLQRVYFFVFIWSSKS